LLRVYSGTVLPIFIEIGLYLTDKEQNISWHSFFLRHGVDQSINQSKAICIAPPTNSGQRCLTIKQ